LIQCINVLYDHPVSSAEHLEKLSSQAFGFNLQTKMVECFRILLWNVRNIHYVQKPGNPVIVLKQTKILVREVCYITYVRNIFQGE
jgi:hypothetical protein